MSEFYHMRNQQTRYLLQGGTKYCNKINKSVCGRMCCVCVCVNLFDND